MPQCGEMAAMKDTFLNILQKLLLHAGTDGSNDKKVAKIKPGYFSILLKILQYTGINLEPIRNTSCNALYRIYSIFMMTYMIVFTITELVQTLFFTTDFYEISFGLCYSITHILGTFKFLLIFINRKTIYGYMLKMEEGLFKPSMSRGGRLEFLLIQRAINGLTAQGLIFCAFVLTVVGSQIISVLSDEGYDVVSNSTVIHERTLPFISWSPFEQNRSPWYEVIFIYQSIPFYCYGFYIGIIDAIICGFFMLLKAQFLILGHALQNVVEKNTNDEILEGERQKRAEKLATNCVEHHQALLDFCKNIEDTFCYVILMQFLSSLLILCLALYQLTLMDNPLSLEAFSMASYLTVMSFQLFYFCYHGNEVYVASSEITYLAYGSDWWVANEKVKKILLMIMMPSQKPCKFTAGKFAMLSLETYVKVIKGSASYFCALQQMREPAK